MTAGLPEITGDHKIKVTWTTGLGEARSCSYPASGRVRTA